jgi:hypothetical protein
LFGIWWYNYLALLFVEVYFTVGKLNDRNKESSISDHLASHVINTEKSSSESYKSIFRAGTVEIHPEHLDEFNNSIIDIIHRY